MAAKRWDFRDEDLRKYSVDLEHQVLSGQRRILVNGREVFRGGKFGDTNSEHAFDVDGHSAAISIGTNGFGYTYNLTVGGLLIPTEGATIPRPPRPETNTTVLPSPATPMTSTARPTGVTSATASPTQGPDPATAARVALVRRVEKGGRPVDEDHRRSGSTLAEEIAVVVAGGHDDQPIDASGGEGRDELLFTGLVFVGTSGEHQNPTLEGDVFDFAVQS